MCGMIPTSNCNKLANALSQCCRCNENRPPNECLKDLNKYYNKEMNRKMLETNRNLLKGNKKVQAQKLK